MQDTAHQAAGLAKEKAAAAAPVVKDTVTSAASAAAVALLRGSPEHKPAVKQLLKDADANVRLQVALGLTDLKDKDAIPVLIELLGVLPPTQIAPAEDILYRLAGEKAPTVAIGTDEESRRKYRDAWAAWWRETGMRRFVDREDERQRPTGVLPSQREPR